MSKTKKITPEEPKEPVVIEEKPTVPEPEPEPELTEEEIKKEQAENELLEDAMGIELENLSEEQKEIIRRNKDKISPEQQEFYKDILNPEPEPEPEPTPEPVPDLKKKLSASARENQKILAKNRVLNQAILDTDEIPEPTEEELQVEFKDWDVMSEVERALAKETVISRNWRARIKEAQDQAKKIQKWDESVDAFIGDPKVLIANPELEGKQEDFATFAKEETNNSVPFKILVGAFLHEQTNKPKNKGAMFPTGSGGPNDKPQPKSDKLTVEEGRKLRESNYTEWKRLLKAGKIEKE